MTPSKILSASLLVCLVGSVASTAPAQTRPTAPLGTPTPAPLRPAPLPIRAAGATPTLRGITPPPDLKTALAAKGKKRIQPGAVGQYLSYKGKRPLLRVPAGQFALEPADMPDPTAQEVQVQPLPPAIQKKYGSHISAFKYGVVVKDPPITIAPKDDHRSVQSPIRNQANRSTCVAHAAVAGLEAGYKRRGQTVDLSENHAYNVFMPYVGSTCFVDDGVPTWKSAAWLTNNRICGEADSPYVPNEDNGNCSTIQQACTSNRRHGFTTTFPLFGQAGGAGVLSINNTNMLEAFIDSGADIVGGFYIAGTDWSDGTAESGVIDVQMVDVPGLGSVPIGGSGGHAMLIVGYDRPGQYFIVRNSWGTGFGHGGYAFLSYDYMQTYAKYGYVVLGVTN